MFSAHNVELVTKQRVEHLTEQEKKQSKKNGSGPMGATRNPLESLLGMAEKEEVKAAAGGASNGVRVFK